MILRNEVWKNYPLNYDYVNFYKVEISNFGRVKTYNKINPEGKIIKGTLQEGYPIVRIALFKERPKNVSLQIDAFNEIISFVENRKKELKMDKNPSDSIILELENLNKKKEDTIQKRKKYINDSDKKRKIHVHFLIHRAVAELFLEQPEGTEVVIHKDFEKTNNNVNNLAWATKEEAFARYSRNPFYVMKKFKENLFGKKYTQSSNSKLSTSDVLYIKEKLKQGKTLKSLATKYKVSDMQIHRIKTGENWGEVKTISEIREEKKKNKKWQAT